MKATLSLCMLAAFALLPLACALDEGPIEELRERSVFDGDEVAEAIAADPDALFFVDLQGDNLYGFDQVEPDHFSHFIVQCPSMPAPIAMTDFAAQLDLDLELPRWSVQSAEEYFRDDHCREKCDKNGTDCILVCDDLSGVL